MAYTIRLVETGEIVRNPNGDAVTFTSVESATAFISEMYTEMIERMARGTWRGSLTALAIAS